MIQDKTQSEENGESFSRAATPYWIIWITPFGRDAKHSPALLSLWQGLAITCESRLAAKRLPSR